MRNIFALLFYALVAVDGKLGHSELRSGDKLPKRYRGAAEERREICMGELGCFKNEAPFDEPFSERPYSPLPDDRNEIKTEFRLFTKTWPKEYLQVKNQNFNSTRITNRGFNPDWRTIFIVHGYLGGNADWAVKIKDALLKDKNVNVFIVDWSEGAGPVYEQAVSNTRVVGAEIGVLIQKLMKSNNLATENVYIIGHSLGSHVSGYAGKWIIEKEKGKKIARITGLDPAGPYFNDVDPRVRLDANDAEFVDAIHTNWASNRLSGFGLYEAIGHMDYYPNGGEDQPGCPTALKAEVDTATTVLSYLIFPFVANPFFVTDRVMKITTGYYKKEIGDAVDELSCSHGRAYEYFLASIDGSCKFMSVSCNSWESFTGGYCGKCTPQEKTKVNVVVQCPRMGYYADEYKNWTNNGKTRTKLYLRTNDRYPFCTS